MCIRDSLSTEQALWAEHQDQDEQYEGPDVLPRAATELAWDVLRRHAFDDAQDQATDHSTLDVPDATQDGRGEGLEAGQEAHPEVDVVVLQPLGHTGNPCQDRAQRERDHDDVVDVDAHQASSVRVLGHGFHAVSYTHLRAHETV